MKLLEVLKKVRRLDDLDNDDTPHPEDNEPTSNEETPESDNDELEFGDNDFDLDGGDTPTEAEPSEDDDLDLDGESDEDTEHDELNDVVNKATEDPNKQGVIRTVKKAHLVYKREQEDGTFEELWIYNVDNMKNEMEIRKAILAGTDIPTNNTSSPEGNEEYSLWACGNAQLLCIKGLEQ